MTHVKSAEGYDVKVPGMGQVNYNTVGASAGIASFLGLTANNILGGGGCGWNRGGYNNGGCCDPLVTRYDLQREQTIAAKDSHIALLESNIYTDKKILETFEALNNKIGVLQEKSAAQAVQNQGFADAFRELSKDIDYKVALEAERRACADNAIVRYVNCTFAPKLISTYETGKETYLQPTYNPLADCGCGGHNPVPTPVV